MDEFGAFMSLSSLLTGLPQLKNPDSNHVTFGKDYHHRLNEQFGGDFKSLLTLYSTVASNPDPLASLIANPLFKDSVESMAKQVVNVWMLSNFRIETPEKKGDAAPAMDAGYFEKGAIWPAIKAHPIGFSHSGSGYWTSRP